MFYNLTHFAIQTTTHGSGWLHERPSLPPGKLKILTHGTYLASTSSQRASVPGRGEAKDRL